MVQINGKKSVVLVIMGFLVLSNKNLGSFGDGGIITMNDKRKYNAIKMLGIMGMIEKVLQYIMEKTQDYTKSCYFK